MLVVIVQFSHLAMMSTDHLLACLLTYFAMQLMTHKCTMGSARV